MVIDHLNMHGVKSIAIDLPGRGGAKGKEGGLTECTAYLHELINASAGPVIVCGHSLGGAIITETVQPDKVSHLVYIAAFAPNVGETALDYAQELLTGVVGEATFQDDSGMIFVDPEAAGDLFYHDCDADIASWAVSQLCSLNIDVPMTPITQASWRHCESTYVICEQDRALPVVSQERISNRCNHVIRWPTSHSPMLSRPELVGDFLVELAMKNTR
jgi:pimeloyl-ACP methyl ester carboxylesterase